MISHCAITLITRVRASCKSLKWLVVASFARTHKGVYFRVHVRYDYTHPSAIDVIDATTNDINELVV